jgi:hypothetical protein
MSAFIHRHWSPQEGCLVTRWCSVGGMFTLPFIHGFCPNIKIASPYLNMKPWYFWVLFSAKCCQIPLMKWVWQLLATTSLGGLSWGKIARWIENRPPPSRIIEISLMSPCTWTLVWSPRKLCFNPILSVPVKRMKLVIKLGMNSKDFMAWFKEAAGKVQVMQI